MVGNKSYIKYKKYRELGLLCTYMNDSTVTNDRRRRS